MKIDRAGPFERLQRRDRRHQFHAVVCRMRFAAFEFLLIVTKGEDRAPAAGPGVARTGTVGVNCDTLLVHSDFPLRAQAERQRFLFAIMPRGRNPARISPTGETAACDSTPADLLAAPGRRPAPPANRPVG